MDSSNNFTTANNTPRMAPPVRIWYDSPYNVTMFALYTFIIIVALIGNVLVCLTVCINPNLRRNVSSYFIVSLAVSDLLTAAFSMPFDLESFMTFGNWPHGEILCIVWTTAYLITVPTSMWNLLILSIDRYKTLKNPWDRFKESPFMTKKRAVIIISVLWVLCMTYALIPVMGLKLYESTLFRHAYGTVCVFNGVPLYFTISSVVNFYLPMLAMCFLYYRIYQIARTQFLRPSSGLELKTCDSNYSPVVKAKKSKRESKEFAPTHRKDEQETNVPSAINNNRFNSDGEANLAMEVETEKMSEKFQRCGTIIEELDQAEEDNIQTRNCDAMASIKGEKSFDGVSEIDIEPRYTEKIKYCENSGTQPEDRLQQSNGINETKNESEPSEKNTNISCGIKTDKDLNDRRQNVKNVADDNNKAESQLPQTKSNENVGIVVACKQQSEGTIEKEENTDLKETESQSSQNDNSIVEGREYETEEKEENFQNSHVGLIRQEAIANESTSIPPPISQQTLDESDSDSTPAQDFLSQDREPNQNDVDPNDVEVQASCNKFLDHCHDVPSLIEQNIDSTPKDVTKKYLKDTSNSPQVSRQMQEILLRKVNKQNGMNAAGSVDSIDSICTVQSTLDDHNRVSISRSNLSASRETLSNFGSMEDLTKRRKIFVKNKKAARTISIIVGTFLFCWFPVTTYSIVMNICQDNCISTDPDIRLLRLYISHALILLGYISSVVNPVIYSYRNVQFRKTYKEILRKVCPCLKL